MSLYGHLTLRCMVSYLAGDGGVVPHDAPVLPRVPARVLHERSESARRNEPRQVLGHGQTVGHTREARGQDHRVLG